MAEKEVPSIKVKVRPGFVVFQRIGNAPHRAGAIVTLTEREYQTQTWKCERLDGLDKTGLPTAAELRAEAEEKLKAAQALEDLDNKKDEDEDEDDEDGDDDSDEDDDDDDDADEDDDDDEDEDDDDDEDEDESEGDDAVKQKDAAPLAKNKAVTTAPVKKAAARKPAKKK